MRLSFAVRITGADTEWAEKNGAAIEATMKEALTTAHPLQLATPDGMKQFENRVRSSANAKLNTDKVQDVVVTDFLYASEQ
jgi:flagellar basal body-associated protein FliL